MSIEQFASQVNQKVIELRRDFHMFPEIAGEESRTPDRIAQVLTELGLEVTRNVGKNGVTALLRGAKPGKTVALRADIDALPVQEQLDLPFASTIPNRMHACGHDAHTAIALGTAMVLAQMKDRLSGTVKFIFQPAEEKAPEGGAKFMIADGCLEDVDAIFGLHVWPALPIGQIGFRYGGMMASSDPFQIEIHGKASHASQPQDGIDATLVASNLVASMQGIVGRQVGPLDSAVVTIGCLNSGVVYNTISGYAQLQGTVRTLEPSVRNSMEARIRRMMEGVCSAYGATGTLHYHYGYPPLVNHREMVDLAKAATAAELGENWILDIDRSALGGEDFAFYLEKKPGAFLWLGCTDPDAKPEEVMPIHNPKFMLNESSLEIGVRIMSRIALQYLEKAGDCHEQHCSC